MIPHWVTYEWVWIPYSVTACVLLVLGLVAHGMLITEWREIRGGSQRYNATKQEAARSAAAGFALYPMIVGWPLIIPSAILYAVVKTSWQLYLDAVVGDEVNDQDHEVKHGVVV